MFVAVLALPVLLVSHALLRKDAGALRAYRWLAGGLALQVGAMLVSAGARMQLYVRGFGLTEDRKSTRLNSSHANISYAVFCLKKKTSCGSRALVAAACVCKTRRPPRRRPTARKARCRAVRWPACLPCCPPGRQTAPRGGRTVR